MDNNRKVVELPLEDVLPNRFQPRIKFSEDAINELCESIKEHGVIQPIVVRPVGDRYEIIAGERRFKASTLAGLQTIPAIIINLNDKDSAEVALIENVQRQDLTPIEEAISYKKILDMGYLNQENLAEKIGKSQSAIANKLRLLNLDEDVQEALLNGKISERHARSLLKLSNKEDQVKLLDKIITERLTVRKTDEEINKMINGEKENKNIQSDVEVLNFDEPIIIPTDSSEGIPSDLNIPSNPIIEPSTSADLPKTDIDSIINPFLNTETTPQEELPRFSDLLETNSSDQISEQNKSGFFTASFQPESTTQDVNPMNYEFNNTLIPNEEPNNKDFTISPNFGIPKFDDSIFNSDSQNNTISNPTVSLDSEVESGNLKVVIDAFRECEKNIGKYGFIVDTEEFDLGDIYQVVFKIHKK